MATFNVSYLPLDSPVVKSDGTLDPAWENYFRSLQNQVSNNFNEKGLNSPTLDSTDTVAEPGNGAIIYDNSSDELKAYVNGAWKTVQTV